MSARTSDSEESRIDTRMPRASVSFPADLYEALERIAKEKKVSVAWVVREAVERYVDQRLAVSDK